MSCPVSSGTEVSEPSTGARAPWVRAHRWQYCLQLRFSHSRGASGSRFPAAARGLEVPAVLHGPLSPDPRAQAGLVFLGGNALEISCGARETLLSG